MTIQNRAELVDVALGLSSPSMVIRGGNLVNVLTHEVYSSDILIKDERIAAVGNGDYSIGVECDVIDAQGQYVVPGFIDPHVHIESSAVTITEFARAVVPRGITSVAEDPHEIANVLGVAGIRLFLEEAHTVPLNLFLRVPGRVPGMPPALETSGAQITPEETLALLDLEEAVCLAGDINPNLILSKDPIHYGKIAYAMKMKKTIGGQSPGLKGRELNAFIAAGPEDSHVSANVEEVLDIVRHGLRALITHRPRFFDEKDYKDLAEAIQNKKLDTRMLLLCTDDIQPHILLKNGHLDERLRLAIAQGIDPVTVIQMVTINVAEFFRIDRDYGSLSPGKYADIVILDNLETVQVDKVVLHGKLVAKKGALEKTPEFFPYPQWSRDTMHLLVPVKSDDLQIKVYGAPRFVKARVINVSTPKMETTVLLRVEEGVVLPEQENDILCVAVLDRHRNSGNIGKGFVTGFGIQNGAVATTINHDAHNIFVVGTNFADMALAANELARIGGGYVAVKYGQVIAHVALPIAGLMSDSPVEVVAAEFDAFEQTVIRDLGCKIDPYPLCEMNFLCLPNIPHLGITDKGLIDSDKMVIIDPVLA